VEAPTARALSRGVQSPGFLDAIKKEFESAAKVGNLSALECMIERYVMYEGEFVGFFILLQYCCFLKLFVFFGGFCLPCVNDYAC